MRGTRPAHERPLVAQQEIKPAVLATIRLRDVAAARSGDAGALSQEEAAEEISLRRFAFANDGVGRVERRANCRRVVAADERRSFAARPPHTFAEPQQLKDSSGAVVATVTGLQDAVEQLKRIERPFLTWAGKAERLSFDVPTLPLFVHERLPPKQFSKRSKDTSAIDGKS